MEIKYQEHSLVNKRGLRLFYRSWESGITPPRRTASIIHGLGDHTGRYEELARFLISFEFKVFGLDLYGFGQSEGKRGWVYAIDDYIRDEKLVYELSGKTMQSSGEKLLIGQSLGGLLALAYLEEYPDDYTLAVILSPALNPERDVPAHLLLLSKVMKVLYPSMPFKNRITADQLSDDEELQNFVRDDQLYHNTVTPRLFEGMRSLSREVKENVDRLNRNMKILFIHGEEDEVTYHGDTADFFNDVQIEDRQLEIIPNIKHETLNAVEKAKTYQILSDWFKRVLR